MCTINARFLEKPIEVMEGYKVLYRSRSGELLSPVFRVTAGTPWEKGVIKLRGVPESSFYALTNPDCGFHFMTNRRLAEKYAASLPPIGHVVVRVRAYDVLAVAQNCLDYFNWPWRRVYVAGKMELLP